MERDAWEARKAVDGEESRIPTDGHPPRKDLMGEAPWGSPGVPRDGKSDVSHDRSTPPTNQAERVIGGIDGRGASPTDATSGTEGWLRP